MNPVSAMAIVGPAIRNSPELAGSEGRITSTIRRERGTRACFAA
jgi:hypothetical protein